MAAGKARLERVIGNRRIRRERIFRSAEGGPSGVQPRRAAQRTGVTSNIRMKQLERVMGIEPTLAAWEAAVLPLNYTRTTAPEQFRRCATVGAVVGAT